MRAVYADPGLEKHRFDPGGRIAELIAYAVKTGCDAIAHIRVASAEAGYVSKSLLGVGEDGCPLFTITW
ncbi:MAG: hypothetical protein KTR19_04995 [Hyphomicrobiales bacterium]|nr:hypothetical protein [Hyphomicrobiales bacterium]